MKYAPKLVELAQEWHSHKGTYQAGRIAEKGQAMIGRRGWFDLIRNTPQSLPVRIKPKKRDAVRSHFASVLRIAKASSEIPMEGTLMQQREVMDIRQASQYLGRQPGYAVQICKRTEYPGIQNRKPLAL